MSFKLEKHKVCASCFSVGIYTRDCICTYEKNYPIIELEFEVCECCESLRQDGYPADTEFNKKQFESLK